MTDSVTIDCIVLKRQAQTRIFDDIKELSPKEQMEYFKNRAEDGALGEWWKRVKSGASRNPLGG